MKIAVPIKSNNQIDGHFGHCEMYGIFTISDNGEISDFGRLQSPLGCGCKSDIASILAADGVTIMLAGGIGVGAVNILKNNGIDVIRGCSGNADEVVRLYIQGLLKDSGSNCYQHESHYHHGHRCNHG